LKLFFSPLLLLKKVLNNEVVALPNNFHIDQETTLDILINEILFLMKTTTVIALYQ